MRILHIITSLEDGGAEAALARLCIHDSENDHHVVSLMSEGKYSHLLRNAGVDTYCLNMNRGRFSVRACIDLWKLVRSCKPDVVQTWMYHANLIGGLVARSAGVKNVCWGIHHSNLAAGTVKKSTILTAKLGALLSKFLPRRIISCSHRAAEVHQRLGYDGRIIVTIENGYELNRFSPDAVHRSAVRAAWGIPDNVPLIGMVARFDPQKDHKNLFETLEIVATKHPDVRCVLVGIGMDEANTTLVNETMPCRLSSRVILAGQRDDIPAVMNALDIHVLSSLGEAFPNVLAEAMACGTPCVTTDVGDAGFIVGSTGWIAPPKNPVRLAECIIAAIDELANTGEWSSRKDHCRRRVAECFSIERMVSLYRKVWINESDVPL